MMRESIDWDLLHQQKLALLRVVWDLPTDHVLWGLMNLDSMQDEAEAAGVWVHPSERPKQRKRKAVK
jgi:hypothetical protein